jgi:hypothetical protein
MKADVTIHIASEADLDALVRLAIAFRDHVGHMTPAAEEFCASLAVLLHDASAEFFLARTRMVKIIMRPRVRSISGAPQVVHSTESCRHSRLPGWIAEKAGRCPSPDDCAPDDNGLHTR